MSKGCLAITGAKVERWLRSKKALSNYWRLEIVNNCSERLAVSSALRFAREAHAPPAPAAGSSARPGRSSRDQHGSRQGACCLCHKVLTHPSPPHAEAREADQQLGGEKKYIELEKVFF